VCRCTAHNRERRVFEGARPRDHDQVFRMLVDTDTVARDVRPKDLGIGKLFERIQDAVIVADAEGREL